MNNIERDLGRIESKVETMSDEINKIRQDLEEIKKSLANTQGRRDVGYLGMVVISTVVTILVQFLNVMKFFNHGS